MQIPVASRPATFQHATISVQTHHAREFVDITDQVLKYVERSDMHDGLAVISSLHTTAAIAVNEHEPELLKDLNRFLTVLAPEEREYAHNMVPCGPEEHPNGHAHCQALLLNTSSSIAVIDGRLQLGRYQRIFLVELDHKRPRRVAITLLGM